jgi:hypothetical protein
VFEGAVELLGGDQTAGVSDICHEPGAFLGGGLFELSVIPVTGVGRGTTDNETGLEDLGLGSQASTVDEVGFRSDCVGKRLEVKLTRRSFSSLYNHVICQKFFLEEKKNKSHT